MMHSQSRATLAAAAGTLDEHAGADAAELTALADGLFALTHLVEREVALRRAFTDPALPGEHRGQMLQRLLGDRLSAAALEVAGVLVRGSWGAPVDLVDGLESLAVRAVLTQAQREGSLDEVEDELFRFSRIVDREPALRSALTDPGLPAERRSAVVSSLLEGRASAVTARLVNELVVHARGRTLERGLEEYARLAAERRQRTVAQVRAAVAPTEEQLTRLRRALAGQLGHEVDVTVEIDPSVVGGLSVQVGDVVWDGSISRRLDEARRRLT